jgi:hypothetical protein
MLLLIFPFSFDVDVARLTCKNQNQTLNIKQQSLRCDKLSVFLSVCLSVCLKRTLLLPPLLFGDFFASTPTFGDTFASTPASSIDSGTFQLGIAQLVLRVSRPPSAPPSPPSPLHYLKNREKKNYENISNSLPPPF